jgi:hypothetical protein
LADWIVEAGIGEARAALVEEGAIVEALIELEEGVRAGGVVPAQLTSLLVPGRRGIVRLESGAEAVLEPLPPGLTEGARLLVEIVREAIPEAGRAKLPKVRAHAGPAAAAPTLAERLGTAPVSAAAPGPDRLEQAGWSELLDAAASGHIPFAGGRLRMSLTPAMTLFDVDGALPPRELACAGAAAAARAVRRFGLAGSIGIDLPTLASKADRQAAAAAFDAYLPPPFERTGVNGFGFLQIVRRKLRPSVPEIVQGDPPGAAARALLRLAERSGAGARTIVAPLAVAARIEARPDWQARLARALGGAVSLRADPALHMFGGHVETHV